jgi:hypothetical protein
MLRPRYTRPHAPGFGRLLCGAIWDDGHVHEHQQPPAPTDPSGIEQPHDVLAADEFAIGTRDERVPPEPGDTGEPHDVLAAEEFAMPAEPDVPASQGAGTGPDLRLVAALVLLAALAALELLRRR